MPVSKPSRSRVAIDGAARACVLVVALLVFLPSIAPVAIARIVSPEDIDVGRVSLSPPCPLRARGLPCWSCGLTRGFAAMARGRVADARRYNPRAPALFAIFSTAAAISAATAITFVMIPKKRSFDR